MSDPCVAIVLSPDKRLWLIRAPNGVEEVGPLAPVELPLYQALLHSGGKIALFGECPQRNQEIIATMYKLAIHVKTLESFGKLFTTNIIQNSLLIAQAQPIQQLQNCFCGVPAILVAIGPSLAKNIDLLKEVKDRAVVIAADTAYPHLAQIGVSPHFVVAVDGQEETLSKLFPNEVEDSWLMFHPSVLPAVPKAFKTKFVTETGMVLYQALSQFWGPKGNIEMSVQCQMHLAANLAVFMGCNPIVFVGQDLCYTDSYAIPEMNYLDAEKNKETCSKGVKAVDINGRTVKTTEVFQAYKQTFETLIVATPNKFLNATEGGLEIYGAENIKLADLGLPNEKINLPKLENTSGKLNKKGLVDFARSFIEDPDLDLLPIVEGKSIEEDVQNAKMAFNTLIEEIKG